MLSKASRTARARAVEASAARTCVGSPLLRRARQRLLLRLLLPALLGRFGLWALCKRRRQQRQRRRLARRPALAHACQGAPALDGPAKQQQVGLLFGAHPAGLQGCKVRVKSAGVRVCSVGCRATGAEGVRCRGAKSGSKAQGSGLRVYGVGCRAMGAGCREQGCKTRRACAKGWAGKTSRGGTAPARTRGEDRMNRALRPQYKRPAGMSLKILPLHSAVLELNVTRTSMSHTVQQRHASGASNAINPG